MQWVRNLRAAGQGELRVGRRIEPFEPPRFPTRASPRCCGPTSSGGRPRSASSSDGVGPESSDAELLRIAPDHPVFGIEAVHIEAVHIEAEPR